MRVPAPTPPNEEPLVGWKAIAEHLGFSQAHVRRLAAAPRFPLPYHLTLGHPWASPAELDVWLRQNTIPGRERELKRARMSTDERRIGDDSEKDE